MREWWARDSLSVRVELLDHLNLLIKYLNIIFISRRTRGCGRRGCGGRNGEITMYIGRECNGRLFGHPRGHTNHDGQQPRGTCSADQQVGHIILMLKGNYWNQYVVNCDCQHPWPPNPRRSRANVQHLPRHEIRAEWLGTDLSSRAAIPHGEHQVHGEGPRSLFGWINICVILAVHKSGNGGYRYAQCRLSVGSSQGSAEITHWRCLGGGVVLSGNPSKRPGERHHLGSSASEGVIEQLYFGQ